MLYDSICICVRRDIRSASAVCKSAICMQPVGHTHLGVIVACLGVLFESISDKAAWAGAYGRNYRCDLRSLIFDAIRSPFTSLEDRIVVPA